MYIVKLFVYNDKSMMITHISSLKYGRTVFKIIKKHDLGLPSNIGVGGYSQCFIYEL